MCRCVLPGPRDQRSAAAASGHHRAGRAAHHHPRQPPSAPRWCAPPRPRPARLPDNAAARRAARPRPPAPTPPPAARPHRLRHSTAGGRRRVRRGRPRQLLLQQLRRLQRPAAGAAQPVQALQGRWAAAAPRAAGGGGRQPAGAAAAPDPGGRRRCRARRSVSAGSGDSDTAAATSRQPWGRSKAQAARRRCRLAARLAPQQRPAGADGGGDDRATLQRRRCHPKRRCSGRCRRRHPQPALRDPQQIPAQASTANRRRCASGASFRPSYTSRTAAACAAAPAALCGRRCPGDRRQSTWPESGHSCPDSRRPSGVAAVGAPGPGCGSCHNAPWLPEGGRRLREGEGEQSRRTETVGRLKSGRPIHSKGRLETSRLRSCSRAVKRPARL